VDIYKFKLSFSSLTINGFTFMQIILFGRDGTVVTATPYCLHGPGIEYLKGRSFPHPFQTGSGGPFSPHRIVTEYFPVVKRWGNLREREHWGDPGVDGRIMLGWIFKKWDVGVRTGLDWLRIGIGGGRL
jgi:hypothetical protein